MNSRKPKPKRYKPRNGSVLVLVVVSLVVLAASGLGLLSIAYGVRHEAIRLKNEAAAMLAAEAGYEQAIYWMSQQQDMLSALQKGIAGTSGSVSLPDADCGYKIELFTFLGYRPVYRVTSSGQSGLFKRTVDVFVIQAISGWDMGMCKVPSSTTGTTNVYFVSGDMIDMPLHVNALNDIPDGRDLNIWGSPKFLRPVAVSESRYTDGGSDKYGSVLNLFHGGAYFDQPDSRVTDETSVQTKVERFRDSTKPQFRFKPSAKADLKNKQAAVQLEFFVDKGVGKVRVTNNCTVRGFHQSIDSRTWDFKIKPGSDGSNYERYDIYAYHVMPEHADSTGERTVYDLEKTYVSQQIGPVVSEPGGQIYVDGNVIIGSGDPSLSGQDKIMGKVTVVATGNIWVADSVVVDGPHADNDTPALDNPNVLGLAAQGVVKVVDPGMSDYVYVDDAPVEPAGFKYVPIGRPDNPKAEPGDADYHKRHLPDPTVLEAAVTVGGGGWGAENVQRGSYGGRKQESGKLDYLSVHGTISEAIRGIHGVMDTDGYLRSYHMDERLLGGILPGDIWLRGKYIPAPAGWHDYRPAN